MRIRELGGDGEEGGIDRKSRDKVSSDTYIGARGSTVIDYIFVKRINQEYVKAFRVEIEWSQITYR